MSEPSAGMRLYDGAGRRLYLTPAERRRFLAAAALQPTQIRALCLTLVYTGCRISEALALTPANLQAEDGIIAIHSLKKRQDGHIRELPIPDELAELLSGLTTHNRRFWPIGRTTAWRQVKAVMAEAGIVGPQATPKGLRHAFAVHAVLQQVPPGILQKWMGHADLATTSIYTQICGPEERAVAARMWEMPAEAALPG